MRCCLGRAYSVTNVTLEHSTLADLAAARKQWCIRFAPYLMMEWHSLSTSGQRTPLQIRTSINALREYEGISWIVAGIYGMSRSRLDGSGGPIPTKSLIRGTSSRGDSASPSFSLLSSLGGGDGVVCKVAVLKTGLVVCDASDLELELASSSGVPGSRSLSCTGAWRRSLLHAHACCSARSISSDSIDATAFIASARPWHMIRLMMFCIAGRRILRS